MGKTPSSTVMVSQALLHQGPEVPVGFCVHSLSGQLITGLFWLWPHCILLGDLIL